MTLYEEFAARFGPSERSVFECVACGREAAEPVVDCPACDELVVRVVVDYDARAHPHDVRPADTPASDDEPPSTSPQPTGANGAT